MKKFFITVIFCCTILFIYLIGSGYFIDKECEISIEKFKVQSKILNISEKSIKVFEDTGYNFVCEYSDDFMYKINRLPYKVDDETFTELIAVVVMNFYYNRPEFSIILDNLSTVQKSEVEKKIEEFMKNSTHMKTKSLEDLEKLSYIKAILQGN